MLDIIGAAMKAEPVFAEHDWTYYGDDTPPEWPELAVTIQELATRVEIDRTEQGDDFQWSRWSTGRFSVSCTRTDDEDHWEVLLELSDVFCDKGEDLFS